MTCSAELSMNKVITPVPVRIMFTKYRTKINTKHKLPSKGCKEYPFTSIFSNVVNKYYLKFFNFSQSSEKTCDRHDVQSAND